MGGADYKFMEPALIKLRPPCGVDELWVLDHFANFAGKTTIGDLFTEVKYSVSHPAVASRLASQLASHVVCSVDGCLPPRAMLRDVDQVIAVPSSKTLARRVAIGLAISLQLASPPPLQDSLF